MGTPALQNTREKCPAEAGLYKKPTFAIDCNSLRPCEDSPPTAITEGFETVAKRYTCSAAGFCSGPAALSAAPALAAPPQDNPCFPCPSSNHHSPNIRPRRKMDNSIFLGRAVRITSRWRE